MINYKRLIWGTDRKGCVYKECVQCQSNSFPHHSCGICDKCYRFTKRHVNPNIGYRNRWAFKFDACIRCNTTAIKHVSYGLCRKCIRYSEGKTCANCGKEITNNSRKCHACWSKTKIGQKASYATRAKQSEKRKALIAAGQVSNQRGELNNQFGKKQTEEHSRKKSEAMKKLVEAGTLKTLFSPSHIPWLKNRTAYDDARILGKERHPNWQGGISNAPYGYDFNEEFKASIRRRDNYTCMMCNKPEEQFGECLSIHHIDYDKQNNVVQNCIALCRSCHLLTNYNRKQWRNHFQSLLCDLYHYQYTGDGKVIIDLM